MKWFRAWPLLVTAYTARGDGNDLDLLHQEGVPPFVSEEAQDLAQNALRILNALKTRVNQRIKSETNAADVFQNYCDQGDKSLQTSIRFAQAELPKLKAQLADLEKQKAKLSIDLKQYLSDKTCALNAISEARAIRKKESETNIKDLKQLNATLLSLKGIVHHSKVKSAQSLSLLEQNTIESIKNVAVTVASDTDRELLTSLLQQSTGGEAKKTEVSRIVSNMLSHVERDYETLAREEGRASESFEMMKDARKKEITTLETAIKDNKVRDASCLQQLVLVKAQRSSAQATLSSSLSLLKGFDGWCSSRTASTQSFLKKANQQLSAIEVSQNIFLSNGAANLWCAGGQPAMSFLQITRRHDHEAAPKSQSLVALRGTKDSRSSRQDDVDSILTLVDKMIAVISKEQSDEDLKMKLCKKDQSASAKQQASITADISSTRADIATLGQSIDSLGQDIDAETSAIKSIDWLVGQATSMRQNGHQRWSKAMMQENGAVDVLFNAKNKLQTFFNNGGQLIGSGASQDQDFGFLTGQAQQTPPIATTSLNSLQVVIDLLKSQVKEDNCTDSTDQQLYGALLKQATSTRGQGARALTNFLAGQSLLSAKSQALDGQQRILTEKGMVASEYQQTVYSYCFKLMSLYAENKDLRSGEIQHLLAKKKALQQALSGHKFSS